MRYLDRELFTTNTNQAYDKHTGQGCKLGQVTNSLILPYIAKLGSVCDWSLPEQNCSWK